MDLEQETLVFQRDGPVDDTARPAGTFSRALGVAVDLDEVFPPHDPGPWPADLSLRREDLYDDRRR